MSTIFPFHYHQHTECTKPASGAQRVCLCEVNPIKVHQQVSATLHHTELCFQSATHTYVNTHNNTCMVGLMLPDIRLQSSYLLSAARFLKSPQRKTDRYTVRLQLFLFPWSMSNSDLIRCCVERKGQPLQIFTPFIKPQRQDG